MDKFEKDKKRSIYMYLGKSKHSFQNKNHKSLNKVKDKTKESAPQKFFLLGQRQSFVKLNKQSFNQQISQKYIQTQKSKSNKSKVINEKNISLLISQIQKTENQYFKLRQKLSGTIIQQKNKESRSKAKSFQYLLKEPIKTYSYYQLFKTGR